MAIVIDAYFTTVVCPYFKLSFKMAVHDEELDELEFRVGMIEQLFFQNETQHNKEKKELIGRQEFVAWEKIEALEKQVSSFECLLEKRLSVADQAIGSKCLAYSIAEEKWVEAEIEEKPTAGTMILSISGKKRKEDCDNLRPLSIDLAAMSRAEDILQNLINACLPPSSEIEADISYPYAIPLNQEAQYAIVQQAEVCP